MVKLSTTGDFKNITKFLSAIDNDYIFKKLSKYGEMGVEALRKATPKDTGLTSECWTYEVKISEAGARLEWWNVNEKDGVPIALVIQYGHAMPNGGYVQGIDYINPALQPIFDEITDKVWKEVTG